MAPMSKLRIARTAEFEAVSLAGETFRVEEYTYLGGDPAVGPTRFQWTLGQKFYMLDTVQAIDHICGNIFEIRHTGERIIRKP